MPATSTQSLINFLNATRADQPKGEYTETLESYDLPLQEYIFEQNGMDYDGGTQLEVRVRYREAIGFHMRGYYEARAAVKRATLASYPIIPAHWQQDVAIDTKERAMNAGGNQIVDLMDVEFSGAYEAIGNNLERLIVSNPQNATDQQAFLGLFHWFPTLPLNQTDATGSFSAFTWYYADGTAVNTLGTLDASTLQYTRLRRWAGTYDGSVSDGLVTMVQRALIRTGFKRAGAARKIKGGMATNAHVLFTPTTIYEGFETRVNKSTQSTDGDALGKYDTVRLRGVPLVPVPAFDALAYAPILGVKLGKNGLHGCKQRGRWNTELGFDSNADSRDVLVNPIVGSGNVRCRDVRGGGFNIHVVRTAA